MPAFNLLIAMEREMEPRGETSPSMRNERFQGDSGKVGYFKQLAEHLREHARRFNGRDPYPGKPGMGNGVEQLI
jgi:hypothetical protein